MICDISGVRRLGAVTGWLYDGRNRHACLACRGPPLLDPLWYVVCSPVVVVRLTLSITAARGESWRLIDALRSLMLPTQRERGCVACRLVLSSESSDPARISYVEDWSSEEDLREQVRSDRFPRLLELMESALEPPRLEFQLASGTRGLDYVEEVRAGPTQRIRVDPGCESPDES